MDINNFKTRSSSYSSTPTHRRPVNMMLPPQMVERTMAAPVQPDPAVEVTPRHHSSAPRSHPQVQQPTPSVVPQPSVKPATTATQKAQPRTISINFAVPSLSMIPRLIRHMRANRKAWILGTIVALFIFTIGYQMGCHRTPAAPVAYQQEISEWT